MPELIKCVQCGRQITPEYSFCIYCGAKVIVAAEPKAAPKAEPETELKTSPKVETKTEPKQNDPVPVVKTLPTQEELENRASIIRKKLDLLAFSDESCKEIEKIVYYIFNRQKVHNSTLPMINLNCAILSTDEETVSEFVNLYHYILSSFDYYKDLKKTVLDLNQTGIDALVKDVISINKPTLVHLKNMQEIRSVVSNSNAHLVRSQMSKIAAASKDNVIFVLSGDKIELDHSLSVYPNFYDNAIYFHFYTREVTIDELIKLSKESFDKNYKTEDDFYEALETYMGLTFKNSPLEYKDYVNDLVKKVLFNHFSSGIIVNTKLSARDIPQIDNVRSKEEIWSDLNALTGLANVKNEVRSLEKYLMFQRKIKRITGNEVNSPNMHMVFLGNPGTGKTTVARLIAELLYNIGFISQNKLIEASPKDLIGQYIGHTAPKTAEICKSAYNGVLFIDEAYELAVKENGSNTNMFRSECLAELIKQMEDNRDRLVVIFAGYTKETEDLLNSNIGLASRIGKKIHFEDYTPEELYDILIRIVEKNKMTIARDAVPKIQANIAKAVTMENFGNGRYVRNLYEKIIKNHSKNTEAINNIDILTMIQPEDIPC